MSKIDTSNWGGFHLGKLLDIKTGKTEGDGLFNIVNSVAYHTKDIVETDDEITSLNYVTRSKFNNGVKCKVVKKSDYVINPKGTISFGAENADFFYQRQEYITGNKMYYLDTSSLSEYACAFLKSVLEATFTANYSFSDGMIPARIYNEIIKLPVDANGVPDWTYMEEYMRNIEVRVSDSISKLESAKKVENKKIDTSGWGEFVVDKMFNIKPTKSYKLTNAGLLDGGESPVVVNSAYNNGIGGTSSKPNTELGNMITFSDTVDANTIFYQENPFIGYSHVQGLYPIGKYANNWSKESLMFFASSFRKSALVKGFDYGNKFRRDIAVTLNVKLPVDLNGDPDWLYMEEYMKALELKVKVFLNKTA